MIHLDRRSFARRTALAAAAASLGWLSGPAPSHAEPARPTRVRLWCEGTARKEVYPDDIDGALAGYLGRQDGLRIARARLDNPHAGLSDADLDATDVLIWWGRLRHDDVPMGRSEAIVERVKAGTLGFVALHASCGSRPFRGLMGMACEPAGWRDDGRPEKISIKDPDHPIAKGIAPFTIPQSAMFAEPFEVPAPESVVFVSTWGPDETFRSGLTWTIGKGRVAYFRPGHDGFPVFFHPSVRKVVANAARWAAPRA